MGSRKTQEPVVLFCALRASFGSEMELSVCVEYALRCLGWGQLRRFGVYCGTEPGFSIPEMLAAGFLGLTGGTRTSI